LVLRTFDHGESDRLVHLYTEKLGRVSAMAKGARRSRRRFPGTLELFALLHVQLVDPPRAALMRLEGAVLERAPEGIVAHLGRYAVACLLVEILDRFTGERESNPDLFHFAVGVLDVVEREEPDRLLALLVLTKTLARLGYRPQLLSCARCGRAVRDGGDRAAFLPRDGGAVCGRCAEPAELRIVPDLLTRLEAGIRTPLRERAGLGLDAEAVCTAESLLERFFRFHVGFELRSAPFLRQTLGFDRLDAKSPHSDNSPSRPTLGAPTASAGLRRSAEFGRAVGPRPSPEPGERQR
jgi:DNA repair protein RecO (recombination protein O)